MYRNVNTVSDGFSAHASDATYSTPPLSMTSLSLGGVYCACTLLGRRICKRVDVSVMLGLGLGLDMRGLVNITEMTS